MPTPPFDAPLNLAMQTVATIVLWALTAVLLAYAVRQSVRDRSAFPVVLVLAVAVGSIIEPLYDISYHLLWHIPGQWTLFTSFDLPQPVWVMPAYVVVFGAPALFLYKAFAEKGTTLSTIFKFAGFTAFTTAVFEITAINLDLYQYYGEHPMRFLGYPMWIAFMEAAQITGFAILAAALERRSTREWHCLALFVIFPANFAFDTLGAGFPTIITINATDPSTLLIWVTGFISIAFAATALWWTSQLLVAPQQRLPMKTPVDAAQTQAEAVS